METALLSPSKHAYNTHTHAYLFSIASTGSKIVNYTPAHAIYLVCKHRALRSTALELKALRLGACEPDRAFAGV